MKYQDFRIRIEAKRGNGFDVNVECPAGSADEHIVLPFDIDEAMERFQQMGMVVRGAGDRKVVMDDGAPAVKPSEFGDQLFRALFTGRVGKLYNAMSRDLQDPEMGLRINLHLNLNDEGVGVLASVPWEFVYDADTMDYLNLSRQTPIVRYLDVQRPNTIQPLRGKLKVLVVMSSPKGVHELDLDKERKLLEKIWSEVEDVELIIKDRPTPNRLRQWLSDGEYHVLHYMGHGAHDENTGVGALVLEDDDRNANLLDAETLGTFLRNAPTVRLAFLNACDLAKTGEDTPFAGVANRLVMAGLPAVVAMQFPISDDAAIAFARTFYSRIARGFPVDEAVAHGRTAILSDKPGSMEWGTPVLYMRTPDGRLFDRQSKESVAPAVEPAVTAAAVQPAPPSSGTGRKIGLAAGLLALIGAGVAGFFALSGDRGTNLVFDVAEPDALTAYIGEPKRIRVGPKQASEDTAYLSRFDVSLAAPAGVTGIEVGETAIINDVWQTDVVGKTTGEYEILATIRDKKNADTEPRKKSVTLSVLVNPAVQTRFDAAIADIEVPSRDTEAVVDELGGLAELGLSEAMRETVTDGREALEAVVEARRVARNSFSSDTIALADKIAAYESWVTQLESARGFEPAQSNYPEAVSELATLRGRTSVEEFSLCSSRPPCSGGDRFAAGRTIYEVVNHSAEASGDSVTVRYFSLPEIEEVKSNPFRLAGNTTSFGGSALSRRGQYEARLYNRDGDLLKTVTLSIY